MRASGVRLQISSLENSLMKSRKDILWAQAGAGARALLALGRGVQAAPGPAKILAELSDSKSFFYPEQL